MLVSTIWPSICRLRGFKPAQGADLSPKEILSVRKAFRDLLTRLMLTEQQRASNHDCRCIQLLTAVGWQTR